MKKILLPALALACSILGASSASAQATRTYVSGVGDDANPCSRTAPCKTFAGAISKTAARGEINCLDSAGYGAVNITKEITIDCTGVNAGILSAGTTGVIVNIPGGAVALKNVSIDGAGSGVVGVKVTAASKVNLENVEIYSHTQQGVSDTRTTAGGVLVIEHSTIRNNAGTGIASTATGGGVILDNVISKQNLFGLAIGNGMSAVVTRSTFSNNVTAGVEADGGGQVFITDSLLTFNGTGLLISGTAAMTNTSVVFNTTGLGGGGTITSFGNNRIFGNSSPGQAVVAAGAATSDLGQK